MLDQKSFPDNHVTRQPETSRVTGLPRSTLYSMLNEKSPNFDPTFPRPIRLGKRSVGWLLVELQQWLETRSRTGAEIAPKPTSGGAKSRGVK